MSAVANARWLKATSGLPSLSPLPQVPTAAPLVPGSGERAGDEKASAGGGRRPGARRGAPAARRSAACRRRASPVSRAASAVHRQASSPATGARASRAAPGRHRARRRRRAHGRRPSPRGRGGRGRRRPGRRRRGGRCPGRTHPAPPPRPRRAPPGRPAASASRAASVPARSRCDQPMTVSARSRPPELGEQGRGAVEVAGRQAPVGQVERPLVVGLLQAGGRRRLAGRLVEVVGLGGPAHRPQHPGPVVARRRDVPGAGIAPALHARHQRLGRRQRLPHPAGHPRGVALRDERVRHGEGMRQLRPSSRPRASRSSASAVRPWCTRSVPSQMSGEGPQAGRGRVERSGEPALRRRQLALRLPHPAGQAQARRPQLVVGRPGHALLGVAQRGAEGRGGSRRPSRLLEPGHPRPGGDGGRRVVGRSLEVAQHEPDARPGEQGLGRRRSGCRRRPRWPGPPEGPMPAAGAGRLADRLPPGFAGGSAPAIGPSGRLARRSPAGVVSVTAWSRSVSAARWSLRPAAESAAATSARAAGRGPRPAGRGGRRPASPHRAAAGGRGPRPGAAAPAGTPTRWRPRASRTSSWANAKPLPRSTSARCASPASRSSSRTGAGRPSTSASNPTSTSGPRTAAATSVGAAAAEGGQPLGHRGVTATGRASPFPGSPPSPSDSDSDSPGPAGTAGGRRCARGARPPGRPPPGGRRWRGRAGRG